MIRSPISSEERLRNRVETLETRVKDLERQMTSVFSLFTMTMGILRALDTDVEDLYDAVNDLDNASDAAFHGIAADIETLFIQTRLAR